MNTKSYLPNMYESAHKTTKTMCKNFDLDQLANLENSYKKKLSDYTNTKKKVALAQGYFGSLDAVRETILAKKEAEQILTTIQPLELVQPFLRDSNVYNFANATVKYTKKAAAAVLVGAVSLTTLLSNVASARADDDRRAVHRAKYDATHDVFNKQYDASKNPKPEWKERSKPTLGNGKFSPLTKLGLPYEKKAAQAPVPITASTNSMSPLFGERKKIEEWTVEEKTAGKNSATYDSREAHRANLTSSSITSTASLESIHYVSMREITDAQKPNYNLDVTSVENASLLNLVQEYGKALIVGDLPKVSEQIKQIVAVKTNCLTEGEKVFDNNADLNVILEKNKKETHSDARSKEYDLSDSVVRLYREPVMKAVVDKSGLKPEERFGAGLYATNELVNEAITTKSEFFLWRAIKSIFTAKPARDLVTKDISHIWHKDRPQLSSPEENESAQKLALGYESPRNDSTKTVSTLLNTGIDLIGTAGIVGGVMAGVSAATGNSINGIQSVTGGARLGGARIGGSGVGGN